MSIISLLQVFNGQVPCMTDTSYAVCHLTHVSLQLRQMFGQLVIANIDHGAYATRRGEKDMRGVEGVIAGGVGGHKGT